MASRPAMVRSSIFFIIASCIGCTLGRPKKARASSGVQSISTVIFIACHPCLMRDLSQPKLLINRFQSPGWTDALFDLPEPVGRPDPVRRGREDHFARLG